MLYCTSVVCQASCSGWNLIYGWILSASICCSSPSPVNWFTLFAVEAFTFFRSTPGCQKKGEQCSVLYRRGWTTLECGHFIAASRTNALVFVRILFGIVDCISLQSAWVEPSSAAVTEFTLILLRISPYGLHLLSTNYSNIWNCN